MIMKTNMAKFREIAESMTNQYLEKQGYLTCEFATTADHSEAKTAVLNLMSEKLKGLNAKWVMHPCDTCLGYDTDRPIHVAIHTECVSSDLGIE